jgi:hypothetical protein
MAGYTQNNSHGWQKWLERFVALDRRWIFLILGGVVVLFLVVPVSMPVTVSEQVRSTYEAIEALPPGARVHLSIDYGPGSEAELWPQHIAILRQLLEKDCKVICSSLWTDGPPMIEKAFTTVVGQLEREGKKKVRGEDYVNLGFKAGDRVAIAKIGSSFKEAFPTDYQGNPTASLPIMQGWDSYRDIDLLITISVGDPGAVEYIQQAQSRYNLRMVAGVTAVISPQLYPYYQSKNLLGFLGGLAGAAEYEKLVGRPGYATRGMFIQSAVHVLIVALVLAGNAAQFALWWARRRTGGRV